MLMLYNSEQFAVVQIDIDAADPTRVGAADGLALVRGAQPGALNRGGYEIVDKLAGKELFLEGAMAQEFKISVEALIETSPSNEEIDLWLGRYSSLAQQPVVLH